MAGIAPFADTGVSVLLLPLATAKPAAARTAMPPSPMATLGPPAKVRKISSPAVLVKTLPGTGQQSSLTSNGSRPQLQQQLV